MKKIMALLCLISLLTGCAAYSTDLAENASSSETSPHMESQDSAVVGVEDEIMRTSFFEFTVLDASVARELQNYVCAHGMKVVAVEVMIHNIMDESVPMLDTDFQLQWEDDAEDAYAWPITSCSDEVIFENQPLSDAPLSDDQLACRYELAVDETITGILYYEVPEESESYSLSFREYFSNSEYGETYAIYFSVN